MSPSALAILVLITLLCQFPAMCSEKESGVSKQPLPFVFVITGESNSGGIGLNSQATPAELKPRPAVKIMNLVDEKHGFEPLQLGVNNLREHNGLTQYYATCHGLENGLANAIESIPPVKSKSVYLIKTGQGGSVISQWQPGNASGYWSTFTQRIDAAQKQLPKDPQWIVWFSLGINDGIAGTDISTWKRDTLAHLQRIKTKLPGCIIVMTQFQAMKVYPRIDKAIQEIAEEEPGVFAVDSTGASLADANHWDYAGLKVVAEKMFLATKKGLDSKNRKR